jgi:large conductance mechanosensitive channel
MLKKFQDFAIKGNAFDLAVGVIIGAAFGGIVSSLVGDVFMPIVGAVIGGLDFSNYFVGLSGKVTADTLVEAKKQGAVLAWGNFLSVVINFVIVVGVMFGLVNLIQRVRHREDAKPAAASGGIADGNSRSAGEAFIIFCKVYVRRGRCGAHFFS